MNSKNEKSSIQLCLSDIEGPYYLDFMNAKHICVRESLDNKPIRTIRVFPATDKGLKQAESFVDKLNK